MTGIEKNSLVSKRPVSVVLVSLNSVNVRANSNLTGKRDESQDLTITISNKITAY